MTKQQPHILITNDDGIHAPGIRQLWQALRNYARVTVVAPALEQSAMGLSTTLRAPLRIQQVIWESEEDDVWSVTGTPADCVKMALHAIVKNRPDLIVAGINRGANLGRGVLYSGTVAAAIESVMQGIPAIAFSCLDYLIEPDYVKAGNYVPSIVDYIFEHPLPKGTLLNVNFPERSVGKFKGFKMTTQGNEWWAENPDKRIHPAEGHAYYWLGSQLKKSETNEGDGAWTRLGYITAVPIHVGDLTDHSYVLKAGENFENLFTEKVKV